MSEFYNLFKSRLESAEEMPPTEVWSSIENRLDENLQIKRLQRRYRVLRIAVCFLAVILVKQLSDSNLRINGNGKYSAVSAAGLVQDSGSLINGERPSAGTPVTAVGKTENQDLYGPAKGKSAGDNVLGTQDTRIKNSSIGTADLKESGSGLTTLAGREPETTNPASGQGRTDFKTLHSINDNADSLSLAPHKLSRAPESKPQPALVSSSKQKNILKHKTPVVFLSAVASKDYYFNNTVKGNDFDNETEEQIRERESNSFSYTLGLLAEFRLSHKWSIQSGLTFSAVNSNISPAVVRGRDYQGGVKFILPTTYGLAVIHDHDDMYPREGDSLHLYGRTGQQLYYLSIPLLLKYQAFQGKKISLTPAAGFALNLITKSKIKASVVKNINQVKQVSASLNGLKNNFYSAYLGLEASYRINPKIALSVQPVLRYSLTSFNSNVPVKNSLNSIAIFGGVKISL